MKKRIEELDMVKGMGMIYVFMRHMCELTGANVYARGFYTIFDHCTEAAMFLFILLSGYVYKSKGSIWHDIQLKIRQLLVPYLQYCTFFTVAYFIRYVLVEVRHGDGSLDTFCLTFCVKRTVPVSQGQLR